MLNNLEVTIIQLIPKKQILVIARNNQKIQCLGTNSHL